MISAQKLKKKNLQKETPANPLKTETQQSHWLHFEIVEDITIFPEGSWGTNSTWVSSSDRLVLREKWKLWQLPPLVRRNMRRSLTSWSKSKSLAPSLSPSTSRMRSPFKLKPYQTPTRAPKMKTDKPSGTRSSSNISLNPLCLERGGFSGRFLCSCSAERFTPRQYRRREGRSRQVWSSTLSGCNSESWETHANPWWWVHCCR